MTGRYDELDLVRDFLKVFDLAYKDIPQIIDEEHLENCAVAIIPRSKAEKTYDPSQLIFKKAISCVADKLNLYKQLLIFYSERTYNILLHDVRKEKLREPS